MKRMPSGRLLVGAVAIVVSIPLVYFALGRGRGDLLGFTVLMGAGCALMYGYYSAVYATIHDVVEPALRGTAMALYFFAMYVLGASLGPYATGLMSDFFTQRAAEAAGVAATTQQALEPFRVDGLHWAMYAIPAISTALAFVLLAAARTVPRDIERLQRWMREG
jgi:MFS family permease